MFQPTMLDDPGVFFSWLLKNNPKSVVLMVSITLNTEMEFQKNIQI